MCRRPTAMPWGVAVNGMKVHPQGVYAVMASYAIFVFLWKPGPDQVQGQLLSSGSLPMESAAFSSSISATGACGALSLTQWGAWR